MKIVLTLLFTCSLFSLYSQDDWDEVTVYEEGLNNFTNYEIGLNYSSSSIEGGVGILVKYKLNSTFHVRATLEGLGRKELTRISNDYNFGGGLRLGIEKRSWSGFDLFWNYGLHAGLGFGLYDESPDNYTGVSFSTGLIGGLNYVINNTFLVGFEILPMVIFSRYGPADNLPNSLDSTEAELVLLPSVNLLYRFN